VASSRSTGATTTPADTSLRAVFAGRRGRLMAALLLAEFAAAVQGIAYSTVLPLASRDLDGGRLYGATLAAGSLVTVLVLAVGSGVTARLGARATLLTATLLYVGGVALAVTAPAMGWLLAGSAVRGLGSGLLAAFGLTAVGGLYEDALRPRVLSLFALVWLLPSLVGPAVNAGIAHWADWRVAMAWPAVVVVVARLLVGRDAGLVPWSPDPRRPAVAPGLLVVGGLLLASLATTAGPWGFPLFAVGVLLSCGAGWVVLDRATGGTRSRTRVLVAFSALVGAFFAGDGLIPLAVVEGLDRGVVATAVAVSAGLVTWSLTGLAPWPAGRRPDPAVLGPVLVALGLGAAAVSQAGLLPTPGALALLVAGSAVAGAGIGLAYPRLSSGALDGLDPAQVAPVATAVAFVETTAVVLGSLLGAGLWSLATTSGLDDRAATGGGFVLATSVALAGLASRAAAAARALR
jgi:MFS family permease